MQKNYFKSVWNKIKNNICSNWMTLFRIIIVIDMLLKSMIFLGIIEDDHVGKILFDKVDTDLIPVYLMYVLLVFSFGYLLSYRKQVIYYNVLNIGYTILLILDLGYFRVNRDFLGLKNIFYPGTFNPIREFPFVFKPIDLIFIVDIIAISILIIVCKIQNKEKRNISKFAATFSVSITGIFIAFICLDGLALVGWDKKMFDKGWTALMSVRAPGPIGFHGYEAFMTLEKVLHSPKNEDVKEIKQWLVNNKENIIDNEYKGILKGKNVVLLQVESLENFVVNRKVNGKEITPNINRLSKEGLYFSNVYEQNNGGNSIDCDFMINTSILPLGGEITSLNYGENVYPNSFPRVLNSEGYETIATHPLDPNEFNWAELHKNGFGVKTLWDLNDYVYDENVGYGLSDKSFFKQLDNKLKNIKQPFLIHAPTLSSHGPFNLDKSLRKLDLPKEIDDSYLGGYLESVHYTDEQIGMFLDLLEKQGILDNTVIVLYGDHGGVHKYYNDNIKDLSFDGDWWKEYTKEIPFIVYSKSMNVAPKEFTDHGGQIDVMPTVLYLLGVDDSKYRSTCMGRILVNTNIDATIIKGNIIKGIVKDEKEKEHLLKAYDVGTKIIEDNYFNRNNK